MSLPDIDSPRVRLCDCSRRICVEAIGLEQVAGLAAELAALPPDQHDSSCLVRRLRLKRSPVGALAFHDQFYDMHQMRRVDLSELRALPLGWLDKGREWQIRAAFCDPEPETLEQTLEKVLAHPDTGLKVADLMSSGGR